LGLVTQELALKHTAFYNIRFSESEAIFQQKLSEKWGHEIALATLLLDRLKDLVVPPSSVGGKSSSLQDFQFVDEKAT